MSTSLFIKRRKFAVSSLMKEQTFPAYFSLLIKINKTGKFSCLNRKRVKKNGNSGPEDPNHEDIRRNVYKSGTRWRRVVWIYVSVPPPFPPYPTENPLASVDKKPDEHLSHCEGGSEENNASPCRGTENRGPNPYASNFVKWGVTNPVPDSFPELNLALENTLVFKLSRV